jgi:hypothetical protein
VTHNRTVVQEDIRDYKTKVLFLLWKNFKIKINKMFGDINKEHIAERAFKKLR